MAASLLRKVAIATLTVVLTAGPALAQTTSPSPTPSLLPDPQPSKSWTYYMAIATIGIAGLTLILTVLGYMVQAPGFRRGQRAARPAGSPPGSA